jgi:hypothetical protein
VVIFGLRATPTLGFNGLNAFSVFKTIASRPDYFLEKHPPVMITSFGNGRKKNG